MSCIVCDNPNSLGCEFCPNIQSDIRLAAIINNDPGDECDCRAAEERLTSKYIASIATYRLGYTYFTRTFVVCNDFDHAVQQAKDALAEGERLITVRQL